MTEKTRMNREGEEEEREKSSPITARNGTRCAHEEMGLEKGAACGEIKAGGVWDRWLPVCQCENTAVTGFNWL